MATLFFRVWEGANAVATGRKVNEDTITIAGTANASGLVDPAGGNKPRYVRLFADSACFVTWNDSPTAANDGSEGMPLGAENPEYVWMQADDKISVIERA